MARYAVAVSLFLLVLTLLSSGQTPGVPPFSTQHHGLYDSVDTANGNVVLTIPVRSKTGLIPFDYSLVVNNSVGEQSLQQLSYAVIYPDWVSRLSVDFGLSVTAGPQAHQIATCPNGSQKTVRLSGYVFIDSLGTLHSLPTLQTDTAQCFPQTLSAGDDKGDTVVIPAGGSPPPPIIYDNHGNVLGAGQLTDRNGNVLSFSCTANCSSGNPITYTWNDNSGSSYPPMTEYVTSSQYGIAGDVHSWTDAAGKTQSYTVNYSTYTQATNFACPNNMPRDIVAHQVYWPSSITAPDGTYQIYYEPTTGGYTGRITKIVMPSGTSIQYQFSGGNNGITCGAANQIMVPKLTRTETDAMGNARVWTYNTVAVPNATVVTDPSGNDTVYTFVTQSNGRTTFESERQYYQGHYNQQPPDLLRTDITCYNGYNSNVNACITANLIFTPINQKDVYTTMAGMSTSSRSMTKYLTTGQVTEDAEYDYGASTPTTDTVATYSSISGKHYNAPNCVQVNGGASPACGTTNSSTASLQTFGNFDANGNPKTINSWVAGSNFLTKTLSYNPNGTVSTVNDVNNAQSSYTYGECNGTMPTSVSEPLSLSRSMTWDCNGGVMTSLSDENQKPTSYQYTLNGVADPFYRILALADPLSNTVNYSYSPTTIESSMSFNNQASISDTLITTDGFARQTLVQKRQAPGSSSFDTVQNVYDSNGRLYTVSAPCSATLGSGCSGAVTTYLYDALNRKTTVTDTGKGVLNYTYPNPDVLVVAGPPPLNENAKSRQMEYDGLGRLTSVCELTSPANGGGTCRQANSKTGYWTTYAYSASGNLTGVTENVTGSQQTRNYFFDGLGRLTSEINPESGTTQYFNDTGAGGSGVSCPGTYNGDLVKRYDANGNTSCYAYDALHRIASTTYSGPNATTNRYFVYDTATVNGQAMVNAKTRVAEAYTATCTTCTKVTDEGFSYTARGELANFYESTPHSGGYYQVPISYWANGVIETFGPFLTEGPVAFGVDGEGRILNAISSTGIAQNIAYNVASQPTHIDTQCGSTCYPITYQYDPNTFRMTQYSVAGLSGGTISGTLTWNNNGSLGKLVIADPQNPPDAQTCTYSHDDLSRIASANCGSVWGQTFSYDAFGNLTKSGSVSWMPGYNPSTNRYTLAHVVYDNDGNLLNDTSNTYTWDAEGKPLSTTYLSNGETFSFLYDAFGHKAEWAADGGYRDSYVTLGKFKLSAVGQSADYSETPLPGGSVMSQGGGSTGYQLADWQGTIRAFYTIGGFLSVSGAHAPFGEAYAYNTPTYPFGFTGQLNDGQMNNTTYYFPERQYRSSQGRWLSPDPAGLAAAEPTNPQTWNRYAYALNNPLSFKDPTGLECVWDDGSYDSNDDPQTGSAGSCSDAGGTWVDHSYFQQNNLADWSGDPNSDIYNYAQNFTTTVTATPCSVHATLGQRVTAGIQGTLNIGLGEVKTAVAGGVAIAGIAGAPETGGLSLAATAAAGYGVITSQGQVLSGMGQLYTAFSGNLPAGQGIQQAGDIIAGPLVGVPTLVATQNPATAQRAANYESFITAGTGFVNSKGFGEAVQGAVDLGLSAMGLAGDDGCN